MMTGTRAQAYDVVVVGGGPAGLSAAVALARMRRSVLVVDAGAPRNAPAGHVHNYLGREGVAPGDLLAAGRREVEGYGGEVVTGTVTGAQLVPGPNVGFRVELADSSAVDARRLVVATGLVDELPDVPGLAERWGREVLHCPYCHGWEVRDQALGVLATSPVAVHQALLFRQLSADVTVLLHTAAPFGEDLAEQLAARGIAVVTGEVAGLEVTADRLTGVRLRSGEVVALDALVVSPRFRARAEVVASLGIEPLEQQVDGHVVGSVLPADATGATGVPGVWVAGNVADLRAQVLTSAAAGLNAAAAVNADLIAEETGTTVAARRHGHTAAGHEHHMTPEMFTQQFWDERYGSAAALWSGNPNPQLVAEVTGLSPGTALDVGSGEGADAVWLARQGWRVTALDVSRVALDRGAVRAAAEGDEIARRITWQQADLLAWSPGEGRFDLVSAQFMHLPPDARPAVFRQVAGCVAPGGVLLVVGHHPFDNAVPGLRTGTADMLYTAADIADLLDPDQWKVVVAEARPRTASSDGQTVTVHDAVLRAHRLP